MKKILTSLIIASFFLSPAIAATQEIQDIEAPKWEDYVPQKYQNPREDFTRGKSIAELSVGILLTDLLITAPIGIPMICHSTTKLKHIGYANKKEKFLSGLKEAETITDPTEKQKYYNNLLSECKLSKKRYEKEIKKEAKAAAKAAKKAAKKEAKAK